jgi:predicted phosphodiesterase
MPGAGALPVLSDAAGPFTFAVLGDTHYTAPDFKVASLLHQAGEEVRRQHPEVAFVCHTGDVVEGGSYETDAGGKKKFILADYGRMTSELNFALRDLREAFGKPVFVAAGNHDKHDPGHKAFQEVVLSQIGQSLGLPAPRTFYAFRYGDSCFLFLDHALPDLREQAAFAEETLRAAEAGGVKHVFAFGHFPLWVIARAGFCSPALTDSLLPLLKKRPVDAYFCGHTHNAAACARRFGGSVVVQIQGISTGSGHRLIPLDQVRSLLIPASETPYCWGYLEGGPMSYSLVRVDGTFVRVQWHVLGQGVMREYGWNAPGQVADFAQPPRPSRPAVCEATLRQAKEAALVFCPWVGQRTAVTVTLNGEPAAQVQIGPTYSMFWDEQRIELSADKLSSLRMTNRVEVGNPGRAVFGLAHLRLEVLLADGSRVASSVCGDFAFSCRQEQAGARGKAWAAAPQGRVRDVDLGQPLPPLEVRFT